MNAMRCFLLLFLICKTPMVEASRPMPLICGPLIVNNSTLYLNDIELKGIHASSFEHIWNGLIKDKNNVYFIDHLLCGGDKTDPVLIKLDVKDSKTFELLETTSVLPFFAKDKYHVYRFGRGKNLTTLRDLDPSFEPMIRSLKITITGGDLNPTTTRFISNVKNSDLQWVLDQYPADIYRVEIEKIPSLYHKDKFGNIYFYTDIVNGADPQTFEVISYQVGLDINSIYVRGKKVSDVDGEVEMLTQPIASRVIAKDNSHVYDLYEGEVLSEIDANTFEYLNSLYAKDKNNVYCCSGRLDKIDQADSESFEVMSDDGRINYAKDKDRVYYRRNILEDADAKTFKVFYHDNRYLGRDKNHVYNQAKIVELGMDNIDK